jgi:hypothetical protein
VNVPIGLEINHGRFYVARLPGILEFQLTNRSGEVLTDLEVRVRGEYLGQTTRRYQRSIAAGHRVHVRLQVVPAEPWEHLLEMDVSFTLGGERHGFSADGMLRALAQDRPIENVALNFEGGVRAGGNIGYGFLYRNEGEQKALEAMLAPLATTNDLLKVDWPERFEPVELWPDPAVAGRPPAEQGPVAVVPGRSTKPMRRLCVSTKDMSMPTVLVVSGDDVSFGRHRALNDVMLRVLPRPPASDERGEKRWVKRNCWIQKESHFRLQLRSDGLFLQAGGGDHYNGTRVDERNLDAGDELCIDRPCTINPAGVLPMRVVPIYDPEPIERGRYAPLGGVDDVWRRAEMLGLRGVTIERMDSMQFAERYLVVYRWVDVGPRSACEIALAGEAGPGPCARLVRAGGGFLLESLSAEGCLDADGRSIPSGSALPLAPGDRATCCGTLLEFGEPAQREA